MRKITLAFLILSIIISCAEKKQETTTPSPKVITVDTVVTVTKKYQKPSGLEIDPYDFDTLLTEGYHLSYRVYKDSVENEYMQSLTLVKGSRDIATLSETSYPMLHKNLGYISGDYGKTFLFLQSYGSGNPHELQLIEKATGAVVTNGVYVDSRDEEKVLLYIQEEHEENEKLLLFDIKKNKQRVITDFKDLKCTHTGGLRECVVIDTVTANEIVLRTDSEDDNIVKRYKR